MEITFIQNGRKRKGILVNCKVCNKEFPTRKNAPYSCCSKECSYKNKTLKNNVEVSCRNCNKLFDKPLSKLNNSKSGLHFCTRKCKDEAQRIGGVKEIMPPHYGTSEGRGYYATLIANTENPFCVGCNEKKHYMLCVHHIDGDRTNNIEENLEIVCWGCHAKRHLRFDEVKKEWFYSSTSLTPRDKLNEV